VGILELRSVVEGLATALVRPAHLGAAAAAAAAASQDFAFLLATQDEEQGVPPPEPSPPPPPVFAARFQDNVEPFFACIALARMASLRVSPAVTGRYVNTLTATDLIRKVGALISKEEPPLTFGAMYALNQIARMTPVRETEEEEEGDSAAAAAAAAALDPNTHPEGAAFYPLPTEDFRTEDFRVKVTAHRPSSLSSLPPLSAASVREVVLRALVDGGVLHHVLALVISLYEARRAPQPTAAHAADAGASMEEASSRAAAGTSAGTGDGGTGSLLQISSQLLQALLDSQAGRE
jgi:hypothetical protein